MDIVKHGESAYPAQVKIIVNLGGIPFAIIIFIIINIMIMMMIKGLGGVPV